jgi:PBP1b-binding outer membrane lipoprotein LpoB
LLEKSGVLGGLAASLNKFLRRAAVLAEHRGGTAEVLGSRRLGRAPGRHTTRKSFLLIWRPAGGTIGRERRLKMPRHGLDWTTFARPARIAGGLLMVLACLAAAGCAGQTGRMDPDSEDDAVRGALGSKDFRSACFEMAQSMVQLPQIQRAAKPPTIAFVEMENRSDELFDADSLLYKMRTELIKNSAGKMTFLDRDIIDKIRQERLDKDRGRVTTSSDKPVFGADYFLAGRIESIRRTRGRVETKYMRISVRLTDAHSSAIVWENDYEVKKLALAGVYDR